MCFSHFFSFYTILVQFFFLVDHLLRSLSYCRSEQLVNAREYDLAHRADMGYGPTSNAFRGL